MHWERLKQESQPLISTVNSESPVGNWVLNVDVAITGVIGKAHMFTLHFFKDWGGPNSASSEVRKDFSFTGKCATPVKF